MRSLHTQVLREPVPSALAASAQQLEQAHRRAKNGARRGAMLVLLLLAFAAGWSAHPWVSREPQWAQLDKQFVRQASMAYAVFSPEVRHPVEVSGAQQEHLQQWLSKRLGRPLKIPQLGLEGFELLGGRLLPAEGGVRAQFMFQNGTGERLTLYLGALSDTTANPSTQETAFRFVNEGKINSFYWVDRGFGYALTGSVPREQLMRLANVVYAQL